MIGNMPGPPEKSKIGPPLEWVESAKPRSVHALQNGSQSRWLYSFTPGRPGAEKLTQRKPRSRAQVSVAIDASMSHVGMYTRPSKRSGSVAQKSASQRL